MALVLSKALLSGVAWQETHNLIQLKYQLEQLIVSYDPGRWNFSENTDLSEVLLIARKLDSTGAAPPAVKENVTCINLWKNPTTAVEALGVAHVVMGDAPLVIDQGQGALEITLGDTKFGEAIAMPWVQLRERSWIGPCAFAQVELLRVTQKLIKGNFILPGSSDAKMNPLCPLGQLGTLGPDRRDIHDGFSVSGRRTAYPAFWGHDASSMMTLLLRAVYR
jgi:hypothetical protein